MLQDIYDPLAEYINIFQPRFKEVTEKTFEELAEEAQVNVEANRETCRKIYENEEKLSSVKTKGGWWKVVLILLWIAVIGGIIVCFTMHEELESETIISIILFIILVVAILFIKIHPLLKSIKKERDQLSATIDQLKNEAWEQMSPLNSLYDWDIFTRMMSQTVPKLEFDPYFTTQRLSYLRDTYNFDDSFNRERSVLYSHSGLINGNPFVICRTRKMEKSSKTYYGYKTIHWTTTERGADGKNQTVHHSETLSASVDAFYPEYIEMTRLIYGNTAAPDLVFYRKKSNLAGREKSLSYKWRMHSIRRKSRNLDNADFAMLTNEEFEVAFDTSNRNNNQQFALLFTPLAQENMLKLLEDKEVGFGDDFDFSKKRMINTIIPDHLQELDLDMNPQNYRHFDFDKAKIDFHELNANYFRSIYFCFAPLLCVPMYQQIRPHHDIYGKDMQHESSFWEHEALANFWGEGHFMHPDCVTKCVLKTECQQTQDGKITIKVRANGYRSVERVTYIDRWGSDGKLHTIPVYWDEYLPVTGSGYLYMKEDNEFEDAPITHRQRLAHINQVLRNSNLNLYRRHIASTI